MATTTEAQYKVALSRDTWHMIAIACYGDETLMRHFVDTACSRLSEEYIEEGQCEDLPYDDHERFHFLHDRLIETVNRRYAEMRGRYVSLRETSR